MEGGGAHYSPQTVEEVFRDFNGRRAGIVRALTTDVEEFFQQCNPEKDNLCLYGFPNEVWEVNLPDEEVPPELPEPVLGINFARDGIQEKDWLSHVAAHSDVPTIFEVVTGSAKKQTKEKPSSANQNGNRSKSNSKVKGLDGNCLKTIRAMDEEEGSEEEDEDEHGEPLCGACGDYYASHEFWICCDICKKWFHGRCVKITPARAEHIEHYKCPSCSNKRTRP